jgi:hypothetical protein
MSGTHFGFSDTEWSEMRGEMRRVLLDVARERRTITYGDLAACASGRRISARSSALMALLGEASEEEDAATGTMLASLVVRADSGIPGDGYFSYVNGLDWDADDREAFWRREIERVWDAREEGA